MLLKILTAGSALVAVAVVVLWVESFWHRRALWGDDFLWNRTPEVVTGWRVESHGGSISFFVDRFRSNRAPGRMIVYDEVSGDQPWARRWSVEEGYYSADTWPDAQARWRGFEWWRWEGPSGWRGELDRRITCCVAPTWSSALVFSVLPAVWLIRRFKRRPLKIGHCPTCNYDLRATPGRCPECGIIPSRAVA